MLFSYPMDGVGRYKKIISDNFKMVKSQDFVCEHYSQFVLSSNPEFWMAKAIWLALRHKCEHVYYVYSAVQLTKCLHTH